MKKIFYFLIASALLFNACSSDDADDHGPAPQKPEPSAKHTSLVFLAIDNNFSIHTDYHEKVEALRANWNASYDGNLLIYADAGNGNPVLVQIYRDSNGVNVADTVINYKTVHNSADPATIRSVLDDVRSGWPAEKHGMIYLSHATGWLPQGTLTNPRSIGSDWDEKTNSSSPNETDLKDFAEALPYNLEYLIFDACFMGAVEVAYELKDKVKYVVGSAAEVLVPGFVYTTMMSHLMKSTPDVAGVAEDFYNYWNGQSGVSRSATVSVVETAKLDALVEISKELLSGVDGEKEVTLSSIQNFRPGTNMLYFDFGDYIRALRPDRYDEFMSALNECIVYKANTPSYYSAANGKANSIREDAFCGLTTYIPQEKYPYMNGEYAKLKWAQAIALNDPVNLSHTSLLYLGIDNNFSIYTDYHDKINALRANWQPSYNGNMLVYADAGNGKPVLVRIYSDENDVNVADTVINYNTVHNSADPAVMKKVLEDVKNGWPADTYGMTFLSHATGWLPQGTLTSPRSIGSDWDEKTNSRDPNEMDIKDFADALPYKLEYIIFDACFMGAVEVAYELKDKVGYIVASPAEVLVPGFVYTTMMEHIMKDKPDLAAVAKDFYDHYNGMTGLTRSATVSVVDTSKLPALATAAKSLLDGIDGESKVDLPSLQVFRPGTNRIYFDLIDYLRELSPTGYPAVQAALDDCIIYKAYTVSYYSAANGSLNPIRNDAFSGLTVYVPQEQYPYMNSEYAKLKWAQAVNTFIP